MAIVFSILIVGTLLGGCSVIMGDFEPNTTPLPSLSFIEYDLEDENTKGAYLNVQVHKQGTNKFEYEFVAKRDGVQVGTETRVVTTVRSAYNFAINISEYDVEGEYEFLVRTRTAFVEHGTWSRVASIEATVVLNDNPRTDGIWAEISVPKKGKATITYFTAVARE